MVGDRPGRRSKLTPKRKQVILDHVRNGNYLTTAAKAAGIGYRTLHKWKEKGQDAWEDHGSKREMPDHLVQYAEFAEDLRQAEAEAEANMVQEVKDSGPDGAKWVLPRRYPERWAKKNRMELGAAGEDGEVTVNVLQFNADQYPDPDEAEPVDDEEDADGAE